MAQVNVWLLYLYQPTRTVQPTIGDHGACSDTVWACSISYPLDPTMIPIDIRSNPCFSQLRHGSACKISPPYVAPFQLRWQIHTYDDPQLFTRCVAPFQLRWQIHTYDDPQLFTRCISRLLTVYTSLYRLQFSQTESLETAAVPHRRTSDIVDSSPISSLALNLSPRLTKILSQLSDNKP